MSTSINLYPLDNIPEDNGNVKCSVEHDIIKDYEALTHTQGQHKTGAFNTVIAQYEAESIYPDYTGQCDALISLATAVSYSVIKKCINVSYSERLVQLRRDLARAIALLRNTRYATDLSDTLRYNTDGQAVNVCIDSDARRDSNTLLRETLGDGYDMVQVAIIAILDETRKARERDIDGILSMGYMTVPYKRRKLHKRVYTLESRDRQEWETESVTPIQVVYRAVRQYIQDSEAMRDSSHYSYIEDMATDGETGISELIYIRTGRYADMGGYVRDYNGSQTVYTVDGDTVDRTQDMLSRLTLTKRQTEILHLRLRGLGYGEIARMLCVSKSAIQKQCKLMQAHARKELDLSSYRVYDVVDVQTSTARTRLSDRAKRDICTLYDTGMYTMTRLAVMYDVHTSTISRLIQDYHD